MHDCWASYLSYAHCGHGLCGTHLLREPAFIVDANRYAWAKHIKRLLQQTCSLVSKRKRSRSARTPRSRNTTATSSPAARRFGIGVRIPRE